jgi:hypothetical protein
MPNASLLQDLEQDLAVLVAMIGLPLGPGAPVHP